MRVRRHADDGVSKPRCPDIGLGADMRLRDLRDARLWFLAVAVAAITTKRQGRVDDVADADGFGGVDGVLVKREALLAHGWKRH